MANQNYIPLLDKIDSNGITEVKMNEKHCAPEEDRKTLCTSGLFTCIGIAIKGVYPPDKARPLDETRHNRFMMHTSEREATVNYEALWEKVKAAKTQGLQDLHAYVTAVDLTSLLQNESTSYKQIHEDQLNLIGDLRSLGASIHWYPYPYHPESASIALYNDGRVVVEAQEGFGDDVRQIHEKPWVDTLPTGDTDSGGNSSKA